MSGKIQKALKTLQKYMDRPWYLPVVALLALADIFIMIIPTDALLVTAVLFKPRRWWVAATCVAVGSSLGALLLAGAVQWDLDGLTRLFPSLFESPSWKGTDAFLEKYGLWALALFAAGPLPYQPAVVLVALSGATIPEAALATFIGRGGKYYLLAYIASHAPKYLGKFWGVSRELHELDEEVDVKSPTGISPPVGEPPKA